MRITVLVGEIGGTELAEVEDQVAPGRGAGHLVEVVGVVVGRRAQRKHLPQVQPGQVQVGRRVALYIEMTHSLNEEKLMVHEARTAASTTPTTPEEFAQTVFAPVFMAGA